MIRCADLQIQKPLLREMAYDAWMQRNLHSDPMLQVNWLILPLSLLVLNPPPGSHPINPTQICDTLLDEQRRHWVTILDPIQLEYS
jgi:hypothetical protein